MVQWRVRRLGRIASTMDVVDAEARGGAGEGLVVVADEQTDGRGRHGRQWVAPPGAALLCSILLRPTVPATRMSLLPLLVGAAVAEAIADVSGADCRLKWPNDVWIDESKVAGILLRAKIGAVGGVDFVNVGIGINVSTQRTDLPPGATSLRSAAGYFGDGDDLLTALLERLCVPYDAFVEARVDGALQAWRRRAALMGENVSIVQARGTVTGTLIGIDDDGALLLATAEGRRRFSEGELMRGPRRSNAE